MEDFSQKLRNQTSYKNVWFHIIDKEGTSLYRSWINKRDDRIIDARIDIATMIEKPQIMSTVSIGRFDMTFKSMVPVYNNGKFIGIFEVITHFNSIVKELIKNDMNAIVLVDKQYKKQLTKAINA